MTQQVRVKKYIKLSSGTGKKKNDNKIMLCRKPCMNFVILIKNIFLVFFKLLCQNTTTSHVALVIPHSDNT